MSGNDNQRIFRTYALHTFLQWFAHSLLAAFGVMVLVLAYWLTDTMPQAILLAGVIFIIPRGLYALGTLDQLKKHQTNVC